MRQRHIYVFIDIPESDFLTSYCLKEVPSLANASQLGREGNPLEGLVRESSYPELTYLKAESNTNKRNSDMNEQACCPLVRAGKALIDQGLTPSAA